MIGDLAAAIRALGRGDLVFYPTDTLWALGASATNERAVERLSAIKGRPRGMPISIAVSSVEEVEPLARLSDPARAFLRRHLPGPYTILVPPSPWARRNLAPSIARSSGTIGIRIPDHPLARELARIAGPITTTSANLHGEPPLAGVAAARRALGPGVRCYLPGAPLPSGNPSTLVDLTREEPTLVRRTGRG